MKKHWKLRILVVGVTVVMGLSGLAGRSQRVAVAGLDPNITGHTAVVRGSAPAVPQGISTSPGRP